MFLCFPWLDIKFSSLFYKEDWGFPAAKIPAVIFVHKFISYMVKGYVAALIAIFIINKLKKTNYFKLDNRTFIFLILALALGPGLVVNTIFKDNWGRARPSQIVNFGGENTFTPPFIIADQCEDNCSFVSGHSSVGFYIMAFAFIAGSTRKKQIMAAGIAAGSLLGLIRIAQGGHFLSDVIFCGFFVYFVSRILWNAMFSANGHTSKTAPCT